MKIKMKTDSGFRPSKNKNKYRRKKKKPRPQDNTPARIYPVYKKLKKHTKRSEIYTKIKAKLSGMYYRDKKKDHNMCDYTYDELLYELATNRCYYCGSTTNLGLDKLDNTKGHTKDNTVVCCYICNVVRMHIFTSDEMKLIGPFIRKILLNRPEKETDK